MIPVRVPAALAVHTVGGARTLGPGHPLAGEDCPVCDGPLKGQRITLVAVGIAPPDQKDSGWTTGGAVAVHVACTNGSSEASTRQ